MVSKTKGKKTAKIITNPTIPFSAMEEIQGRSPVGGKVAMIERGAKKARVIDMSNSTQEENAKRLEDAVKSVKSAKSAKKDADEGDENEVTPSAPHEISLKDSEIETIREMQDEINSIDLEIGRNTKLYLSTVKKLEEASEKSAESFRSEVRRIIKRHKAPEGWVVDINRMVIVPNPNQPPQVMSRPPSN